MGQIHTRRRKIVLVMPLEVITSFHPAMRNDIRAVYDAAYKAFAGPACCRSGRRGLMKNVTDSMDTAARLNNTWAVLLTVVAALVLVSCATSNEPVSGPAAVGLSTQTPASTVSDTSTPAASTTSNAVIRVGIIESVEGDTLSVETVDGAITVRLTGDSIIQEFAERPLEDLAIGQRVTVIGQEAEAGFAARAVIVSLENTSLFQDEGDFEMGRGSRALVGIIERVDDGSITVSTILGPRTATINIGETAFRMPSPASTQQLSRGQLVTVIGSENAEGGITARSVLITPELGSLMSAGRTGGRRGQGGGSAASETAGAADPTPPC